MGSRMSHDTAGNLTLRLRKMRVLSGSCMCRSSNWGSSWQVNVVFEWFDGTRTTRRKEDKCGQLQKTQHKIWAIWQSLCKKVFFSFLGVHFPFSTLNDRAFLHPTITRMQFHTKMYTSASSTGTTLPRPFPKMPANKSPSDCWSLPTVGTRQCTLTPGNGSSLPIWSLYE